jgi:hypothetical protein
MLLNNTEHVSNTLIVTGDAHFEEVTALLVKLYFTKVIANKLDHIKASSQSIEVNNQILHFNCIVTLRCL